MDRFSWRRPKFRTSFTYDDLASQLGSDGTTVPRLMKDGGLVVPKLELPLHVQAVVTTELDASWIGRLLAAVPTGTRPLKWKHIERYVAEGNGSGPQSVRQGLESQTVVLTDVLELTRGVDLELVLPGQRLPVVTMLLLGRLGATPGGMRQTLRRTVQRVLLHSCGIARLGSLITQTRWPGIELVSISGVPLSADGIDLSDGLIDRLGDSLRSTSRLASQATVFMARNLDPDRRGPTPAELYERMEVFAALPRNYARRQLMDLADQQIAFDADDPRITAEIERLRSRAHDAADEWGVEEDSGGVTAVDDTEYLRVQLADIAAGWARTIVAGSGLLGLVQRFRLVLYNGRVLRLEEAGRLDKDRNTHRSLLSRVSG